ncbi:MAG TPA: CoA transferase [Acidimicrobiales bacterium]|nr:CoA transferase [Acidimicrobiales bacterium]
MALPLAGLRVVDLTVERGELCARLLADLGADVVKVEPPGGSPARQLPPRHGGVSLWWALRNAGKRSVVLDLPAETARLDTLLAASDVLVVSAGAGEAAVDVVAAHRAHPHLVVTAIAPYGLVGPWAGRRATDGVLATTGTITWKAGTPDREPLMPPASFVDDSTSVTFAFATLCALWQREPHGAGQLLDCSQNEAIANMSDWALANNSVRQACGEPVREVRAGSGPVWPSLRCADGFVRVVILAPRQWRAMRAWLGEPDYLQDPELDSLPGRLGISATVINPLIEELFATMTMAEIAAEAQRRGIVCTPLASPADVMAGEHFIARRSLVDMQLGPGVRGPVPSGFLELDGCRVGPLRPPPGVGEHTDEVFADLGGARPAPSAAPSPELPLRGTRVADFGHGGVGVEAGKLLAEYGADVIKVESRTYPDFIRVASGSEMSPSFASANRSKRGFGANAKTADGHRVLVRLIGTCDVVIENSTTGVMDELGLGYDALRGEHPGLVMVSSQLMGASGPWAQFRGYGPSTRAAGGLEVLWDYGGDRAPAGSSSIFPDQLCGRIGALGAVAALIGRRRSGRGAHIEVAQVETTIGIVAEAFTKEALEPGSVHACGNRRERGVPWGVFRCAGEEQWAAITCRDDAEWAALVEAMGRPSWAMGEELARAAGRATRAAEVEAGVGRWAAGLARDDVVARCQAARVPAGELLTPLESIANEHYLARGFRVDVPQPGLLSPTVVLDGPGFTGSGMRPPVITPAPWIGEHTRQICTDELAIPAEEVERLIGTGALETTLSKE